MVAKSIIETWVKWLSSHLDISVISIADYFQPYLNQITCMCKKHSYFYSWTGIRIFIGFAKKNRMKFRIDYSILFLIPLVFVFVSVHLHSLACTRCVWYCTKVLLTCSSALVMWMHVTTSRVYRVKIVYSNSCLVSLYHISIPGTVSILCWLISA